MAGNDILGGDIIGGVNVTQSFDVLGTVMLWGFIIVLVLGMVYLLYYLFSFKNTLIIRDTAHNRKVIRKVKWKETKDRKNVIWMVSPFNRMKKPLPPSDAIEITPTGKKWVEAWRGEDSESLIYAKDTFNYDEFSKDNTGFQPLTTQERELLVNQVAKAAAYKTKNVYEMAVQITMIMAPIILIAVIGLTLGDISEGLTQFATPITNTMNTVADSFVTASENLAGIQTVEDVVPVEVPN
jgi:hypothetical protein